MGLNCHICCGIHNAPNRLPGGRKAIADYIDTQLQQRLHRRRIKGVGGRNPGIGADACRETTANA